MEPSTEFLENGLKDLEIRARLLCLETQQDIFIVAVAQGIIFITAEEYAPMIKAGIQEYTQSLDDQDYTQDEINLKTQDYEESITLMHLHYSEVEEMIRAMQDGEIETDGEIEALENE